MSYVVTLTDYAPSPRTDSIPWTQARIEEASLEAGPWTLIDTITLDPVDADPASPQDRSFTTENATLENGWYRVTFADATGDTDQPTDPVQNTAATGAIPSVREVAQLLPMLTRGEYGAQLGTFTSETTPTAAEVRKLISFATFDVFANVDGPLPEALENEARSLVALNTALFILGGALPEQAQPDSGLIQHYRNIYTAGILRLKQRTDDTAGWSFGSLTLTSSTSASSSLIDTGLLP